MPHLPDFFIVGAAKAGTTALFKYLDAHPEIGFGAAKETHIFSTDIDQSRFRPDFRARVAVDLDRFIAGGMKGRLHQAFVSDRKQWEALFSGVRSNVVAVGDATVSHLWSAAAAQNIYDFNPQAKIIIVLRNPVERAFSHYLMDRRMGFTQLDFAAAVKQDFEAAEKGWGVTNLYVELGLYCEQVKRYRDRFPAEQVKVVWYQDYRINSESTVREIFRFLGVAANVPLDTSEQHNAAKLPRFGALSGAMNQKGLKRTLRKLLPASMQATVRASLYTDKGLPSLSAADRVALLPLFADDIHNLSVLLGRDLSRWLTATSNDHGA